MSNRFNKWLTKRENEPVESLAAVCVSDGEDYSARFVEETGFVTGEEGAGIGGWGDFVSTDEEFGGEADAEGEDVAFG